MSGSEFERENIVTDALSAAAASKPAAPAREHSWRPPAEGLYDPSLEKDSCGVGFIANIKGKKSHQIVPTRSTFSAISSIAARSAPIRARATAPEFWCRSPTPSSHAR